MYVGAALSKNMVNQSQSKRFRGPQVFMKLLEADCKSLRVKPLKGSARVVGRHPEDYPGALLHFTSATFLSISPNRELSRDNNLPLPSSSANNQQPSTSKGNRFWKYAISSSCESN